MYLAAPPFRSQMPMDRGKRKGKEIVKTIVLAGGICAIDSSLKCVKPSCRNQT